MVDNVGVFSTNCQILDIVDEAVARAQDQSELELGKFPSVDIEYSQDLVPLFNIPMHIEYVLFELLKNSFRAVVEYDSRLPPVKIHISMEESWTQIKIVDFGGGIPITKTRFNYTTAETGKSMAGLGYGLALSKLYMEFLGGSLELKTEDEWTMAKLNFKTNWKNDDIVM